LIFDERGKTETVLPQVNYGCAPGIVCVSRSVSFRVHLSERIYFKSKKLLSTSAEVTGAYLKQTADSVFIPITCALDFPFKTSAMLFISLSEGLHEICKIGNKYEITAKRLFLHDFINYFYCSRILFFKIADDFLYHCNIHRIVENSREHCTPPSQR
ncbi:hypothetical protein T02_15, partial [Trichinella nativa]